jgi:hypothetical protein
MTVAFSLVDELFTLNENLLLPQRTLPVFKDNSLVLFMSTLLQAKAPTFIFHVPHIRKHLSLLVVSAASISSSLFSLVLVATLGSMVTIPLS